MGILDYGFIMSYYKDTALFHDRMQHFYDPDLNNRYVVGLGIYTSPKAEVIHEQIATARKLGMAGFCFFSQDWFMKKSSQKQKDYGLQQLIRRPAQLEMTPQVIR